MQSRKFQNVIILLAILVTAIIVSQGKISQASGSGATEINPDRRVVLSFDDQAEGTLPPGWKIDATDPRGPLANWAVVTDQGPAKAGKVLSLTKVHDPSKEVFNLCWNPGLTFQNGAIEVTGRGNSGVIDQGGGIIWRARNASNYYIMRYNPLETNLRLYVVKDGNRRMLADAGKLDIKTGEWFTIKVVHQGDLIEGWLNGKKLLEKKDRTITSSGGVGFWTKADAASSFKDLQMWSGKSQ